MIQNDVDKKDLQLTKIFIERTFEALKQYNENLKKTQQSYAHTLFINACVGFLMTVNESVLDDLPTSIISEDEWGISPNKIEEIKGDDKSVRNIVTQVRHSIAHFNFKFDYSPHESMPIERITLKNWNGHLEIKDLDFNAFRHFVLKVAEEALKIIDNKIK